MKKRYLLLILVVLLILTEIFLRLFISKPSTQQFDELLGYTNIPGRHMIESQEGYGFTTFNSLGFNDDEPDAQRKRKIFVIGDSYTEAFQIDRNLTYTSLLEDQLSDSDIDIIKLARDSFLPLHYPIVFERYQKQYNPELTILQLGSHTLFDLSGDNIDISFNENGEIDSYTISLSEGDKQKEIIRSVINNSALAYYLLRRYKQGLVTILQRIKSLITFDNDNTDSHNTINKRDYGEIYIKKLSFILSKIKGKLLIVYFPDPGLMFGSEQDSNKYRDIIKSTAETSKVGFLDLTEDFKNDYYTNKRFLNGFSNSRPGYGHLNRAGHKVVAEALQKELLNLGYGNK